jgi:hypothetical protein
MYIRGLTGSKFFSVSVLKGQLRVMFFFHFRIENKYFEKLSIWSKLGRGWQLFSYYFVANRILLLRRCTVRLTKLSALEEYAKYDI